MSYQVLARKWRPKSFSELMGQEHVVTVLVNALTQKRLHHAYLFTGTRGVGKTTIARIFAKSLNCETGITATPCGVCDACVDIDQGKFVDLLEIDAASRTKVDDTREILDNVQYAPTRGRYKVYLIDEVHMLSKSSFNALLKTLEEPPEHVKFILATTDPQKLPVTVLSRCLQFHLKALTIKQISDKVIEILNQESVSFDDEAIALLAKAARGSMRDCLSLTDQCIAQGNGNITRNDVQQMLGGVDRDWVFKILVALLKQDATALMQLSLSIASYAPSYSRLSAELIQLLHQIAMTQVVEANFSLPTEHQQLLTRFCQLMSPEDVQLYYQIVLTARKDLPYADDEQAAFDMMLLRLLAFKPVVNNQDLPVAAIEKTDELFKKELDQLTLGETASIAKTDDLAADNLQAKSNITTPEPELSHSVQEEVLLENDPFNSGFSHTAPIDSDAAQPHASSIEVEQTQSEDAGILSAQESQANDVLTAEMLAIDHQANSLTEQIPESQSLQPEQSITDEIIPHQNTTVIEDDRAVASTTDEIADSPEDNNDKTSFSSPVAAAIATRNMLRSRKKSMEEGGKKPNGAKVRPISETSDDTSVEAVKNNVVEQPNVPDLATLPEQPYSEDVINPATIKLANQVDKWAHMIDSMSLIARLRQLAIHATVDEASTDDVLILQLDQSIKHLNSDAAHKQLEARISEYLQRQVTVELNIVEKTVADPYQIQSDINAKRYEYAKQVLAEDEIVIALQQQFQAELDQETIVAR
ncbi:DNA polymerase III subunit gamma/tau [Cognaticolwellia beringensis]|uniref:DNA polymerase III subunit gamma/tau n=1 Tax=Cognaticolwellia beringensis TaxID=1967665 RepID=A0A222G568_9GAMM|nr:DNA polymerase III subunit gamma/tau [Cognaticolwellia beringensis]ASP46882.1 DNA polymerase III subunit gamma/tau [Cognaticolwellia beringensis]